VLLSTAYASTAVASARMSLIVRFCLPRWTALSRFGMAIAARMPMIAMTISSSIRVKPDSRFFMTLYSPIAIEILTVDEQEAGQGGSVAKPLPASYLLRCAHSRPYVFCRSGGGGSDVG